MLSQSTMDRSNIFSGSRPSLHVPSLIQPTPPKGYREPPIAPKTSQGSPSLFLRLLPLFAGIQQGSSRNFFFSLTGRTQSHLVSLDPKGEKIETENPPSFKRAIRSTTPFLDIRVAFRCRVGGKGICDSWLVISMYQLWGKNMADPGTRAGYVVMLDL